MKTIFRWLVRSCTSKPTCYGGRGCKN